MDKEISNRFREAHGKDMAIYRLLMLEGTEPRMVPAMIKGKIPSLDLAVPVGGKTQHGFINTKTVRGKPLEVWVALHLNACPNDIDCPAGHGGVRIIKTVELSRVDESNLASLEVA